MANHVEFQVVFNSIPATSCPGRTTLHNIRESPSFRPPMCGMAGLIWFQNHPEKTTFGVEDPFLGNTKSQPLPNKAQKARRKSLDQQNCVPRHTSSAAFSDWASAPEVVDDGGSGSLGRSILPQKSVIFSQKAVNKHSPTKTICLIMETSFPNTGPLRM